MKKTLFPFITLVMLASCGYSHNSGNQAVMNFDVTLIQIGKTTKQDMLEKLGPPQNVQKNQFGIQEDAPNMPPRLKAAETWAYWSQNIEGKAVVLPFVAHTSTQNTMKIITLYFDKNGIAIDYAVNQTGQ